MPDFRRALLAALLFAAAPAVFAQHITIAPGSLVLTDARRNGEIIVANTASSAASYRIEPVLFRMRADGLLDEVDALAASATKLVRFAPRQFELAPGGAQVVRVAFRAPADLPHGEYRLHLRMRNLGAPVTEVADVASPPDSSDQIAAKIPITVARAARILVRHGVGDGTVSIENLAHDDSRIRFDLAHRKDGGSVNGRVRVESGERQLAEYRFSVYADLDRRSFTLPMPQGVAPQSICVTVFQQATAAPERRCAGG